VKNERNIKLAKVELGLIGGYLVTYLS